jgi:Bacterial membrane protein YfhO
VRFRILPKTMAEGREPLVSVLYFVDCDLYDWGTEVTPRVSVVPNARVVKDPEVQARALFDPLWDAGTVLVTHDTHPAGRGGTPAEPQARISSESSNRVVVDAAAGADGGYLLMLDSYASGWHARVDDGPAEIVQANGLFRAVHLGPGRHTVAFSYWPAAMQWGSVVSLAGLVIIGALVVIPARRRDDSACQRLDRLIGLDDLDAALQPTRRSA